MCSLGFEWIDVRPFDFKSADSKILIDESALRVSCIGASFGLPEGATMDAVEKGDAGKSQDHIGRALTRGKAMGASVAYVVPEMDGSKEGLSRYSEVLVSAADQAQAMGMKLCIEHFPEKALPTARGTLEYIRGLGHPNVFLLMDTGHLQISGEDPVETIEGAGEMLGYVHLDDNDGVGDLHLALLDGVLKREVLSNTLEALSDVGYAGAVSLELNPSLPDPIDALRRSREIVLDLVKQ
jgi:D-psicose/D-tagatose/L-ribulose 3-epimerase